MPNIEEFIPVHLTAASFLSRQVIFASGAASAIIKLNMPDPHPKSHTFSTPLKKCLLSIRYSDNNFR